MAMSAKASDDIAWLPATAQLAVLAAKKVSSAELVELYLSRIDTYNASLNAIVTVDPDAARRVAKRSDAARARGDELGPLHGLPITVKDSYETAGMRTTCGRRDLADYVPTQDAEAVARLRRAGAIIMGKTNMPTGNQDVQASNPVFGRTNNPWDAARTSGGSAGGGAAATAAGLTSFDYGSEIGGSTRIPAHYCGLYGHKSTWRSVPLVGHIPSAPGNPGRWGQADMACAGVQVRGARDIIPALEATVGPMRADGGFSYALAPPRAGALKDFRVAVWAEDPHCPIDADVRRAMDDAVAALRAAGAHVVEQPATIPVDMAVSHNIFQSLVFGAFAVDRSTLSPASAAALGLRAVRHVGASPQPKYTDKFTCRINRCTVSVISTPISIQGVGVPQRQAGDIGATYQDAPTKSINVGGTRFVYRRLGADAGVPVIFLHHLGAVLDNWDPRVVDGIAAKHPVVTFDNRGVGASEGQTPDTVTTMADDAIAFVRALGFDQVDLLGFSLGGFVAQVIAQQEPQLVRKIILAGTGPAGGVGIGKVTFGTIRESIKATLTFRDPKELRFFTRTDSGKSAARQFVKRLKERKDNRDKSITVRAFRSQLKAIHAWGTQKPSDLTSIGHPVLIANGDDDTMVPTSNSLDLADRLPDATLRIYPDAGHGGIFQHHAQFVDDALQFLES